MENINFYSWLLFELDSAMMSLITVIEKRDNMRYYESEKIRIEYMDKIGNYESDVLASELEATLLKKKIELIQACINRREPIDMEKINSIIEAEKKKHLEEVKNSELNNSYNSEITDEAEEEMKRMYKEIVAEFHPEINHNMTQLQKEAFEKAVNAYKSRSYEAMKLAYDMLFQNHFGLDIDAETFHVSEQDESIEGAAFSAASWLEEDYSLAAQLFDCFKPLENDMIIKQATEKYLAKIHDVEKEIDIMNRTFPFNAVETLNDPQKTQEYIDSLKYRMQKSKEEIEAYTDEIAAMTGER